MNNFTTFIIIVISFTQLVWPNLVARLISSIVMFWALSEYYTFLPFRDYYMHINILKNSYL